MTAASLRAKAQALLELHSGPKLLVLPNVWDPIGARVLESKGHPAVATASSAISSSLGFQDGEKIARSTMLEVVSRISHAVDVPVTADMEAGYAASTTELGDTVRALLDCGAAGLNIEDSLEEGGALRPVDEQAERIAQVREVAAGRGIHLVINARVDAFLSDRFTSLEEKVEEAARRADVYARAGADCIYPIGPGDAQTLAELRARIPLPLNALATADAAPLDTMAAIGIRRVSFGPFIFRSCLGKFVEIIEALSRSESYECFGRGMLSRLETTAYLRAEREEAAS